MTTIPTDQKIVRHQSGDQPARRPPLSLAGGVGYVLALWKSHGWRVLAIFLLMTVYLLFKTFFALTGRTIIDSLQTKGYVEDLGALIGTLGVGFVVAFGFRFWAEWLIAQTSAKILNDLRLRLFVHLQRLAQGFYTRTPVGNILARFTSDVAEIEKTAGNKLRDGALDLLEILYNLPVLFYLDWRLATLVLFLLAIMVFSLNKLIAPATSAGYEVKGGEAKLATLLQENVRAQPVIRAFGLESQQLTQFVQQLGVLGGTGATASFLRARVSLGAKAWLMAFRVIVTIVGALLVTQNSLTAGSLIAFLALLELINISADNLTRNVLPDFIATTGGIQRVEELLQEQPDSPDRADAVAIPPLQQAIQVNQLSFSYSGQENNLHTIDMVIPAGSSVAFVGPSGSGKSTLLSLLMRAHEPTTGSVQFDGVDLRQVLRTSLQRQMGVVFQETYLFDTTIRENIRMAKAEASNAEVEQAARLAEIHDLIMSLPQQYETRVGEAGGWLSGGQRQRIAIARAIIRNPALLLLDEATSALDPGTEAAINATLRRLAHGRTVISVTHRLSAVIEADCIFVLQAGRLVEAGTHHELLPRNGLYTQLWQKQASFAISPDGRTGTVQAAYLRHVALFAALDMATLTTVASRFSPEYISQGQIVFPQGAVGDKLYLIARGQVEVLVREAEDEPAHLRRIDTMQDGDHFGEVALLSDAPRNATIRTLTDSLLLTLPKVEFLQLVNAMPAVRAAVDRQIERNRANRTRLQVSES